MKPITENMCLHAYMATNSSSFFYSSFLHNKVKHNMAPKHSKNVFKINTLRVVFTRHYYLSLTFLYW